MNILTPYHTRLKVSAGPFDYLFMCIKIAGCVANSIDPDEMLYSSVSDLGLHCLLWQPWWLSQMCIDLGPAVQSVVSLTSSLRVISLTVLADSIYNILIFFAEKM